MIAKKKTILLVFGTRPEAIKMCPLVTELKSREEFNVLVCVTGQHKQMLDAVLSAFDVVPDFDLGIMKQNQTLFDVTTSVLDGVRSVVSQVNPDAVLVHGDTTSSFAAALACFYLGVPVGHVEAGLRTYNVRSPFPEEFNRVATGIVSTWNFAPTETARLNLMAEHRSERSIFVTGNTGIDALRTTVTDRYTHPELEWASDCRLILITAHRRENLGEPMCRMFRAIRKIVEKNNDVKAIYPIHLNPLVRKAAHEELDGCDRLRLIEPLDVLDFHNFLARSYLVLTDSGGIQEEAPGLGKPVLVMRDTTERPEGIETGTLKLVGTDERMIYDAFDELLNSPKVYDQMSRASNPYGDGHASEKIADILAKELG